MGIVLSGVGVVLLLISTILATQVGGMVVWIAAGIGLITAIGSLVALGSELQKVAPLAEELLTDLTHPSASVIPKKPFGSL